MKRPLIFLSFIFCLLAIAPTFAESLSYKLKPVKVAEDTYIFQGSKEHFSLENGGNIVNTGFIITKEGVIVIDTGPSARYGHEMRNAINEVTPLPINRVIVTHHHPDHFLGNQAFSGAPIWALPETIAAIRSEGDAMNENLYRLVGDWMLGTEVIVPGKSVNRSGEQIGEHRLRYIALQGHDIADLAILDETTGVLFAGDQVFMDRAPTTPHADIGKWLESLDQLEEIDFRLIVPGHGPVIGDNEAIRQTREYLQWLVKVLEDAADQGLEMTEVMNLDLPNKFKSLATVEAEYRRSVHHLWPEIVKRKLPKAVDRRID
ncbi:MAG: quinoprotein relay system zinc metallohydrolase 1 [Rhodospirillaceae bacterium]|nr:quinoprotein relay system zinc metallohydrolase 1 [Rhodospirillaceae bacterium]MBL6930310.1 quinoprotein relay system zinc metallohydrolase 1 [Rhodospirillales bacterium]